MSYKTITFIGIGLGIAAIAYVLYNNLSQLKDIDYDLFETEEDEDD